jgi:hypothetical protein
VDRSSTSELISFIHFCHVGTSFQYTDIDISVHMPLKSLFTGAQRQVAQGDELAAKTNFTLYTPLRAVSDSPVRRWWPA